VSGGDHAAALFDILDYFFVAPIQACDGAAFNLHSSGYEPDPVVLEWANQFRQRLWRKDRGRIGEDNDLTACVWFRKRQSCAFAPVAGFAEKTDRAADES
jgi:hypothetical protein